MKMQNGHKLLVSDKKGNIVDLPNLEAAGMKGACLFRLNDSELIKLPSASKMFMLPHRHPIGYDPVTKTFVTLHKNPYDRKECFAVAVFISSGHTVTYNSAYKEVGKPKLLPLFSYAAVTLYDGEFYVAGVKIDTDIRHNTQLIDIDEVQKKIKEFRSLFPGNRLIRHLIHCALIYGCPNAQNFFLSRFEAPLPTSPLCNASCAGCISYQAKNRCGPIQLRIKFIPTPREISEVALFHIDNTKDAIVSFGQGCEGEPLLSDHVIEESLRLIRNRTVKGIININTNASRPSVIARLFDAGLDSMRVSLNSVREEYYNRYYRPKSYKFYDVINSIRIAKKKNGFVWLNYLTMPGFTDLQSEFLSFKNFIGKYNIDMIQYRCLNFDPLEYFRQLKITSKDSEMLGIKNVISIVKKEFPQVMVGYFNPTLSKIKSLDKR